MKPHPRIRKTIKWGGAAVTVLLVVVWIGTGACWLNWVLPESPRLRRLVSVQYGCFIYAVYEPMPYNVVVDGPVLLMGFHRDPPVTGRKIWHWGLWSWSLRADHVCIPLWGPLVAMGLASAAAWRLDTLARRRARLNLCPKCNYDRAGIGKDAVCPECGAAAPTAPLP